jgi:nucleoside-diphosphate-sugar epimerase
MDNPNNASAVLVAGATGFLGSEICRQLMDQNKKVKTLRFRNFGTSIYR